MLLSTIPGLPPLREAIYTGDYGVGPKFSVWTSMLSVIPEGTVLVAKHGSTSNLLAYFQGSSCVTLEHLQVNNTSYVSAVQDLLIPLMLDTRLYASPSFPPRWEHLFCSSFSYFGVSLPIWFTYERHGSNQLLNVTLGPFLIILTLYFRMMTQVFFFGIHTDCYCKHLYFM